MIIALFFNLKLSKLMRDCNTRILFVCLGNICRSPMAETVMNKLIAERNLEGMIITDSSGIISYHAGEKADSRMRMHAGRRGYKITHLSRPTTTSDFSWFDIIVAMDDSVYDSLKALAPSIEEENKVVRMTDYCKRIIADHVPDPYYGGAAGFENVINILEDACEGLLEHILKE